jgi:WD40 repeat protein
MHKLRGHINDVVCCEFSPDGMLLATGSYDTKGNLSFSLDCRPLLALILFLKRKNPDCLTGSYSIQLFYMEFFLSISKLM